MCGCDSFSEGAYGTLYITPNCVAALRQLRHTQEKRMLWIDSICIDQSSIEERNEQVAHMGEIYWKAQRVIVWLGEKDNSAERAIRTLAEIGDLTNIDDPVDSEHKRSIQRKIHAQVEALERRVHNASEDPIGPLFTRTWFHRMWTVQEATLSQGDRVAVHCGDVTIPWHSLVIALDALQATKYRWGQWKEATQLQKHLSMLVLLRRYPGAREFLDDNPGDIHNYPILSHILMYARVKASTDPKDKVFALFSVLEELGARLPAPDYGKAVEDIYTEAAAACVHHDKNLYVLFQVSWPAFLRQRHINAVPAAAQHIRNTDPRYPITRGRFAAAGGSNPRWNFPQDSRQLVVRGKVIDHIIYRTASFEIGPPPSSRNPIGRDSNGQLAVTDTLRTLYSVFEILKSWVDVSAWGDSYPSGETVEEALQRTLVNNLPENNADARTGGAFGAWHRVMISSDLEVMVMALQTLQRSSPVTRLANAVTSIMGLAYNSIVSAARSFFPPQQPSHPPLSHPPFTTPNQAQPVPNEPFLRACMQQIPQEIRTYLALTSGQGWGFHSLVMAFSNKKYFLRTENGYFGAAPDMIPDPAQAGDRIALIGGLEMPFVLRPVDGGYRLVTHCYLHGVMHGEAWPERDQDLEQITLL